MGEGATRGSVDVRPGSRAGYPAIYIAASSNIDSPLARAPRPRNRLRQQSAATPREARLPLLLLFCLLLPPD